MVPSNFTYSLREAGHHFRRNWSTVLGAIVTIFLSLFIIGAFVLASNVLSNMVGSVEDKVTIQAFLADDADQATVEQLQSEIEGWDNVESVTYRSKDENLAQYRTSMSQRNASDAVAALDGQNPHPGLARDQAHRPTARSRARPRSSSPTRPSSPSATHPTTRRATSSMAAIPSRSSSRSPTSCALPPSYLWCF